LPIRLQNARALSLLFVVLILSIDYIFLYIQQNNNNDVLTIGLVRLYYYSAYTPPTLRLKRGHIMLIVGGAMAVISFSTLGYYILQFVSSIQQEGKYTIQPGRSINVQQSINDTQGIYVITFADFEGHASVIIKDRAGKIIVDKNIDPPIIIESFNADVPGLYDLTLLNPTDQVLEAAIDFGDQEHVLSGKNLSSAMTVLVLISLLGIGIAVAIAGAVIAILDRSRINKMKQFGDTSDLI
jgi:hypothetical protein